MAKQTRFTEYKHRYANYGLELREGILEMECHTNSGSLVWGWKARDDVADESAEAAFLGELGDGLARETYAQRACFPLGRGMEPRDRAWDAGPWSG